MKNLSIYLLAIGTFLTGTSEMIVAGIVNIIAKDLHITVALAGQLVTAFSLAFAIGTPIIVTITSRLERKKVLLGSLGFFLVGNLISSFPFPYFVLLTARVILGASAGVFIVVAMSVASKLVSADKIGNAISTVSLGFGTALVLGVPAGVALTGWLGWKSIFILLAVFSFFIMIPLAKLIPTLEGEEPVSIRQQLSILKNGKIFNGLLIFFFLITGYGASYTYLTPFLQENLHLDMNTISLSMLIFGIFSIIGTRFGGYGSDRWGTSVTIVYSVLFHAVFLITLPFFTDYVYATLFLAALWVSVSNITIPSLQTYFIQQAPQSSELALSASTSMAQLGLATGAGAGGLLVNASGTVSYNPWFSALAVGLAFVIGIYLFFSRSRVVSQ
ncbi:MFS transporter [Shimazuella sp. AN120528]|uniref:MFS transporter n=1 Tax=Shimazuella soli TaxID=1892854 RepID=UPI001F0D0FEF|nr:MFS transporter [Shimazuella soli]MCH5585595.1 MFS transporter [Shimazuella soli]